MTIQKKILNLSYFLIFLITSFLVFGIDTLFAQSQNTATLIAPAPNVQLTSGQQTNFTCSYSTNPKPFKITAAYYFYESNTPGVFFDAEWSDVPDSGTLTKGITIPSEMRGSMGVQCVAYFLSGQPEIVNQSHDVIVSSTPIVEDSEPPSMPVNIGVESVSSSSINFSWSPSMDNVNISGYYIYRSDTGWVNPIAFVAHPITSYSENGLISNRTYRYRVRAVDTSDNLSKWGRTIPTSSGSTSATLSVRTPVVSMPTNVNFIDKTSNTLTISWNPSPAENIFKYFVYRNDGGSTSVNLTNPIGEILANSENLTFTTPPDLTPNTTYRIRVRAVDNANNLSSGTPQVSASTLSISSPSPETPIISSIVPGNTSQNPPHSSLVVSWNAESSLGYNLFRSGSENGNYIKVNGQNLITSGSYIDSGLSPQSDYFYKIQACFIESPENCSGQSNPREGSTMSLPDTNPPTVPNGLNVVSVTDSSISIAWQASTDAEGSVSGYNVFRSTSQNGTYSQVGGLITGTTFNDSALAAGVTRWYKVRACDDAATPNCSAQSDSVSGTTLSAPTAPQNVSVGSPTINSLTVSWQAPTSNNATSYRVFRNNGGSTSINTSNPIATVQHPSTSFVDLNLNSGTTYRYRVVAINSVGQSPLSPSTSGGVSGTTSSPQVTISSIQLVQSNGGQVIQNISGGQTINVGSQSGGLGENISIIAITNPSPAGSVVFSLQKPDGQTHTQTENSLPYSLFGDTGESSYTPWQDLQIGGYTLTITPYSGPNGSGQVGVPVTIQFQVVNNDDATPPNNPTNVAITYRSPSQIRISWTNSTSSDVATYRIHRDNSSIGMVNHPTNTFTDSNVNATSSYSYRVTAIDQAGNEANLPTSSIGVPNLSNNFSIDNNVRIRSSVSSAPVKSSPESSSNSGVQPSDAEGVITNGPVWVAGGSSGVTHWYVEFSSGTSGWVSEASIEVLEIPPQNTLIIEPAFGSSVTAGSTIQSSCSFSPAPSRIVLIGATITPYVATTIADTGWGNSDTSVSGSVTIPNGSTGEYHIQCVTYGPDNNQSNHLNIVSGPVGPDTTPPTANIVAPSNNQVLPAGTTSTSLSVTTNEAATCKWHTSNTSYANMLNTMSGSGTTNHTANLTGLSNGQSYIRYIRCQDSAGNPMSSSVSTSFSVASVVEPPPPPPPPGGDQSTQVSTTCPSLSSIQSNPSTNLSVPLCAEVQNTNAQPTITLKWTPVSGRNINSIVIHRRNTAGSGQWTQVGNPSSSSTSWTDSNVTVGQQYEYRITINNNAYGYIVSGINTSSPASRGRIVLVVENSLQSSLSNQIQQLIDDLNADRWLVSPIYVSRTDTPVNVRNSIKSVYDADPVNTKGVYLLGDVPVPSVGNVNPDGHASRGMSSDLYYGEMTNTINNVAGGCSPYSWGPQQAPGIETPPNTHRFCLSSGSLPSPLDLFVGRVDMSAITAFGGSESSLTSDYLNKVREFKRKQFVPNNRAFVRDFFQQNGWSHGQTYVGTFSSIVNSNNLTINNGESPILSNLLNNQIHKWVYGNYYGGSTQGSAGDVVGSTSTAANSSWGGLFNILWGSYYGEWNTPNAFLRGILASGKAMNSVYGGPRFWYFHGMSAGQTIGESARISVNNNSQNYNPVAGSGGVSITGNGYMSLMGDPTIRDQYVGMPSNLVLTNNSGKVSMSWNASSDSGIGYNVYEITTNEIRRVNSSVITGTSYNSNDNYSAGKKYMVTRVKIQETNSGTYINESLGVIATTPDNPVEPPPPPPPPPSGQVLGINGPVGPINTQNVTPGPNPYGGTDYYVACVGGNDSNNGTSINTPWATLSRLDSVKFNLQPGARILLQRGCKFRGYLHVVSSGTPSAPITYDAYGSGPAPIISGTNRVTSAWTQHQGNIWRVNIGANRNVEYLFIDSAPQNLAKYPNTGYAYSSPATGTSVSNSWIGTQPAGSLVGARMTKRTSPWSYQQRDILTHTGSTITYNQTALCIDWASCQWEPNGWGFIIENKLSLLDSAGEWFYDNSTGDLYLWAPGNANPNNIIVEFSNQPRGIDIGLNRTDLRFKNMILEGFTQYGFHSENNRRVVFENMEVRNSAKAVQMYTTYGVAQVDANIIRNNYFHNTYKEGVWIMGGDKHLFEGNVLRGIAIIPQKGAEDSGWNFIGIHLVGDQSDVIVRRNRIDNVGYIGIAGTGKSLIEENHVSRADAILNDGAGIAFDKSDGLIIRRNVVENTLAGMDSMPVLYPGYTVIANGIYWGNHCMKNTTVTENTIIDMPSSGIWMDHTMCAENNFVTNNTIHNAGMYGIGLSDYGTLTLGTGTPRTEFNDTITGNKIYSVNQNQLPLFVFDVTATAGNNVDWGTINNNYYHQPFASTVARRHHFTTGLVQDFTLPQWRQNSGYDMNSSTTSYSLTNTNQAADIFVNNTNSPISQNINGCDANGNPISGNQTIQPFRSLVVEYGGC